MYTIFMCLYYLQRGDTLRRMFSYMMIGVGMAIAFKMMEDTQIMRDLNKMMRKRMRMIKICFKPSV